jgi:phosphatidate cytidylyltransferase
LASSALLAPVVLALVWLGGPPFVLLAAGAAAWCAFEYCRLVERAGLRPAWPIAVAGAAALAVAPATGAHLGALGLVLIVLGPGVYYLADGSPMERAVGDWAHTTLGAALMGLTLAQGVALRLPVDQIAWPPNWPDEGALRFLAAMTCTWASDSFAYVGGRLFGRRPFFPAVSPKKTREGAIAGVLAATIVALLWARPLGWPLVFAAVVGASAGVVATIGDLLESMLKRAVGAKDSGNLIPGHGGLLDRVDGLLLALLAVAILTGKVWP